MSLVQSMIFENKVRNFNTHEHFVKMNNGDVSQRNTIITQWLGLASKIANSFEVTDNCDFDDYFSVAIEGLISAVDNFDLSKGVEFSTYATTCIRNEIIRFKKNSRRNEFSSLDVPLYENNKEPSSEHLVDFLVDENDGMDFYKLETKMEYEKFNSIMKSVLSDREIEILELRFGIVDGRCWSYRDISNKFGVTGVYEIINRSILKIQRKMFSNKHRNSLVFQTHLKQKTQLVYAMRDEIDKILSANELEVIKVRFGLLDGKVKKQSEVNKILGLSKVYIGELERNALIKLQVANSKKLKTTDLNS